MYENEIYTNSDSSNYATYQTGSVYGSSYNMNNGKDGEKKKKKIFRKFALSMGLGITSGAFAGAGFYAVQLGTGSLAQAGNQEAVISEMTPDAGQGNGGLPSINQVTYVSDDISNVVANVMPAMVSIVNTSTRTTSFWGYTYQESLPSAGSGIIVGEKNGELLIVSNNHVVANADSLEVTFIDGTTAEAHIKGQDSEMDLAVISVPLESLSQETRNAITIATLGDSDSLKLGQPVIAIGNALGNGQSVTNGIVSALNREVTNEDGTTGSYIQTNAAINGGNSGGALLTITGEVIGINSGKIKATGVEGMGYAIPISSASPIIADLMERQTRTEKADEEERGYLGISGISVTQEVSAAYGMPEGVYISQVYENTAAAAAGLRKGDIIVEFGGDKISSMDILQKELEFYAKGDVVDVTVMSPGVGGYESRTVELTLGNKAQ